MRMIRVAPLVIPIVALALTFSSMTEQSPTVVAGKCLAGFANVEVDGSTFGPPSPICAYPTDCDFAFGTGPNRTPLVGDKAYLNYAVTVPLPADADDVTCYL